MSKTTQELSAMKTEDLVEYVASLSAEVDKKEHDANYAMDKKDHDAKTAMDEKDEEHKTAMEHERKMAMEHEDKKHEATLKAVLKAMEEDDHEKRKDAVKSAMEKEHKTAMEHGHEDKNKDAKQAMEDDDEKKALKAQVTYLATVVKNPKIQYLTKVYQAALTPEATLKEYVADWNGKTPQQLDAEIKKITPLVQTLTQTNQMDAATPEIEIPMMSTLPTPTTSYQGSVDLSKINKMSDKDLFRTGR